MTINDQLRADAAAHIEQHIDMHSIVYRQGREIAQTYVNMMKSYARLDVQSGNFTQRLDDMLVSGFCRIEERHFGTKLLQTTRKQNFWTTRWAVSYTLMPQNNDLYEAFMASMTEFCRAEQIHLGKLCALVRTKQDTLETKELPLELELPAYVEAIGFPYEITF